MEDRLILRDLNECKRGEPDVIVEVAHPDITKQFGALFLQVLSRYTISTSLIVPCNYDYNIPCEKEHINWLIQEVIESYTYVHTAYPTIYTYVHTAYPTIHIYVWTYSISYYIYVWTYSISYYIYGTS